MRRVHRILDLCASTSESPPLGGIITLSKQAWYSKTENEQCDIFRSFNVHLVDQTSEPLEMEKQPLNVDKLSRFVDVDDDRQIIGKYLQSLGCDLMCHLLPHYLQTK